MARTRTGFASLTTLSLVAGACIAAYAATSPQQQPSLHNPPPPSAAKPAPSQAAPPAEEVTVEVPVGPMSLTEALLQEIAVLNIQLAETRAKLADSRLKADSAQRELEELRQFVIDHQRFGDDFQQYKAVKDTAEREAQRASARSAAEARNYEADRVGKYRRMGFTALGLDVFTSKMAFYYNTKEEGGNGALVDYDTIIGHYLRPGFPSTTEIDYSKMTISGSVLNASDLVRNIGVAITFFDESGNQVGHETVEIKNARPDVPYPFTSKIEMALNRAFASSSTYVLYADPVE